MERSGASVGASVYRTHKVPSNTASMHVTMHVTRCKMMLKQGSILVVYIPPILFNTLPTDNLMSMVRSSGCAAESAPPPRAPENKVPRQESTIQ